MSEELYFYVIRVLTPVLTAVYRVLGCCSPVTFSSRCPCFALNVQYFIISPAAASSSFWRMPGMIADGGYLDLPLLGADPSVLQAQQKLSPPLAASEISLICRPRFALSLAVC